MSDLELTTVVKTMFKYEKKFKQLLKDINVLNTKMEEYLDGFTAQEKRRYATLPTERKFNAQIKEIQRLHRELLNKLYNTENERDIHDLINELSGVSNNNAYSIHKHYKLDEKYDKYLIPYLKQMKLFKDNPTDYKKPFLYIDKLYKFLIYKICLHFLKYRKYILNPYYEHYDNAEMILKQRLYFLLILFPNYQNEYTNCDPNKEMYAPYYSDDDEDSEYLNCNEEEIDIHLGGILEYGSIKENEDELMIQYNYKLYEPYFNEFKNRFNINLLNSVTEIANSKLRGNEKVTKIIADMSGYIADNNNYIKHKKLIEKTNADLAKLVKRNKAAKKIQNAYKKHTLKRKPKSLPHLNALSAPTPVPPLNESKQNMFIRTLSAASVGLREQTSRLVNRLRDKTQRNRQQETQNPMMPESRLGGRKQKTRKNKRRKT